MSKALLFLCCCAAAASVVDRVAVVIDKTVITEGEVQDEVRLTEFLNGQPLDLSASARRAAADRLVDQTLIRNEVEISHYAPPSAADTDKLLQQFRQQHFRTAAAYREALARYGITEDQLKRHLIWQLTALRFTDLRFRSEPAPPGAESADRAADGSASSVDQQMDAWLKQARGNSKIVFKQEAFQ
ncbi:MAG TPA: hypothetical protein VG456_12650 [Candidatus Sulfopaludibacter sp.]|jgi:hypothetical protein|nr:hypothetical protein [Candidatus Sulfopaludibacter sp.]